MAAILSGLLLLGFLGVAASVLGRASAGYGFEVKGTAPVTVVVADDYGQARPGRTVSPPYRGSFEGERTGARIAVVTFGDSPSACQITGPDGSLVASDFAVYDVQVGGWTAGCIFDIP